MAEGQTLAQAAWQQRWCMETVPEGQEKWPQGETAWHPMRGTCKGRGVVKVDGPQGKNGKEWRCKAHAPRAH